jgi:hypothetical protein
MANARQNYSLSNRWNTKTVTEDDIDILLKLAEVYNTAYDLEAAEWFWRKYNREVTPFEKFRNKYPQGTKGAQLFEKFTSNFELAEILREYEFLDENMYYDRYGGVQIECEGTKSVIYGIK